MPVPRPQQGCEPKERQFLSAQVGRSHCVQLSWGPPLIYTGITTPQQVRSRAARTRFRCAARGPSSRHD